MFRPKVKERTKKKKEEVWDPFFTLTIYTVRPS